MVRKMLKLRLGTRIAGAALALVPVVILAAGCGSGTATAGPGATVPRAPSTSTTSADPYAIPSPITAAYVQRVLDEIDTIRPLREAFNIGAKVRITANWPRQFT